MEILENGIKLKKKFIPFKELFRDFSPRYYEEKWEIGFTEFKEFVKIVTRDSKEIIVEVGRVHHSPYALAPDKGGIVKRLVIKKTDLPY